MGDLIERLRAVEGGNEGTHWYRNPDGPEAAARIAELEAEVARLREALRHYASDCDATETTPCTYEGNLCCRVARAALAAPDTGGADGE